jgi:hypothetical protein
MTTSNLAPKGGTSGPSVPDVPVEVDREDGDRAYRRAWWALALFPVTFALAFVVGEGLFSVLTDGETDTALWKVLLAGLPALLVFALPGALAMHLGRAARRLGRRDGMVPAIVGAAIAAGFVGLNAVSYLLILLSD